MAIDNYDFDRVAGDTYPEVIKLSFESGESVNIEGWNVYMNILEDLDGGTTFKNVRIVGEIVNFSTKEVQFYPRIGYSFDMDNPGSPVDYEAFTIAGKHSYSLIREKLFYYADDSGLYVYLKDTDEYVLYDVGNPAHNNLQRLSQFTEIMTHQEGEIAVTDRLGW